jgi:hypothetical protein
MSYGVNDMRDGVNLSRMQVTRPLVMHTEVTNLPNLCGYLRFGRDLPVVRFQDNYNRVASACGAFEERISPPIRLAIDLPVLAEAPPDAEQPPAPPQVRRRRAKPRDNGPELPLMPPPTAPGDGEDVPASGADIEEPVHPSAMAKSADTMPALTLYGKPTSFRLRQHGRQDGARNSAVPA